MAVGVVVVDDGSIDMAVTQQRPSRGETTRRERSGRKTLHVKDKKKM